MKAAPSRSRVVRVPPARLSAMTLKSSADTCVNCGLPAHSPIAQTLGALVSNSLVDADVAATVQLDTCLIEPDPGCVRNAPRRDQDVAALDLLLTGGCAHGKADFLSGFAVHIEGLSRH